MTNQSQQLLPRPSVVEPHGVWISGGKRIFDFSAALIVIAAVSPLALLILVVAAAMGKTPIFFRQDRAGLEGKIFRTWKFRSMRAGRIPDAQEIVPLHHPEITTIGRFLRRTKLDELPQLINVLTGEMSIVGPRPTLPDQVARYDPFRRQRLMTRPGITGLAQVYSSAADSWDERILYDIAYIKNCSPLLDLRIMVRTILVMLLGESRTTRPFRSTWFSKSLEIPPDFTK